MLRRVDQAALVNSKVGGGLFVDRGLEDVAEWGATCSFAPWVQQTGLEQPNCGCFQGATPALDATGADILLTIGMPKRSSIFLEAPASKKSA